MVIAIFEVATQLRMLRVLPLLTARKPEYSAAANVEDLRGGTKHIAPENEEPAGCLLRVNIQASLTARMIPVRG